ncbi:MAG: SPASM domain-containing protein [Candidatus Omnitrophica bacterium]|nr:SPASM domain-containing protein [Candidatus Omnitrophota bacterium]
MINKEELFTYVPPKAARLSVCSACQLDCPACEPHAHSVAGKKNGVLGWGYMRAKDFAAFIRSNPSIKTIEISHSGEIFLNPELGLIIKDAFEQNVTLTAGTGVNLNKVSEQMCEDLVKYRFQEIKVAIDGADQKTYAIYRRGGNFDQVIHNIKRINFYKEKYKSQFPILEWQFIPFSHNEHQILIAKKMAMELNMKFKVKLNARVDYAPIKNKELIRKMTPSGAATRDEHQEKHATSVGISCHELWLYPQINWNGMMTGCCANYFENVGNVFEQGLEAVMKSERYVEMKKAVLGISAPSKDIPCSQCPIYFSVPKDVRIRSTLRSLVTGRTHG